MPDRKGELVSLFLRMLCYAILGLLFGFALGWSWWALLPAAIGFVAGLFQEKLQLGVVLVVAAAIVFLILAVIGVGTVSTGWLIVGAIVAAVLFILEASNTFDPSPSHA